MPTGSDVIAGIGVGTAFSGFLLIIFRLIVGAVIADVVKDVAVLKSQNESIQFQVSEIHAWILKA